MNPASNQTYITPEEIGKILHLSYHGALAFVKYSGVKYVKINRCYRVNEKVLFDFLATHKNINTDEFKAERRDCE